MLFDKQSKSTEEASNYFDTTLSEGNHVTREQFKALLSGKHPVTGEKLVQRSRIDRRPGIDLIFSVPKSISLVWAINKDEKVFDVPR